MKTWRQSSPKEKSWANWHISRGRLSHNPTRKELRAKSWRRLL